MRRVLLAVLPTLAMVVLPPASSEARVFVAVAPRPLVVERAPPVPGPGYVWRAGYWAWNGGRYVWVRGAYVVGPRPGAVWAPGHWARRPGGWVWVGGHWRR